MMNCLCCGKPIDLKAASVEGHYGWHIGCVKKFFGTTFLPVLDVSKEEVEELANQTVAQGYTVPGVQKKLSLHLSHEPHGSRLTLVNYPTGYILKPQTAEYASLPEYEYLAMNMAKAAGIRVVPCALIRMGDGYAYITRRIDRKVVRGKMSMCAMEDFCQLGQRLTQDKYRGSYEQCVRIIQRYSSRPLLDLTEFFMRLVFCYVIGNSDMHLKNFSLIETAPGTREFCLSEAYDLLPVNLILPEDHEEMALTLNGKKQKIRKKDFLLLAEKSGIARKTAENLINKVCSCEERWIDILLQSMLNEEQRDSWMALIQRRLEILR